TTYTWELASERLDPGTAPFHPAASALAGPMGLVPQPGPLLVALDLHLLANGNDKLAPDRVFDRSSLAMAEIADGTALMASDFQCDPTGFIRILVLDRGLYPDRAGAEVQRVLELDHYRSPGSSAFPDAQVLTHH